MCVDVSLQGLLCPGTQLSLRGNVPGWGVLRAHGAPADHLGWEGRASLDPLLAPGAASGWNQAFPAACFPLRSQCRVCSGRMKVVVPVSVCGPRDPPLWDLETPTPAQCFPGTPALLGVFLLFLEFGVGSSELPCPPLFHIPSQGKSWPVGNAVLNVRV